MGKLPDLNTVDYVMRKRANTGIVFYKNWLLKQAYIEIYFPRYEKDRLVVPDDDGEGAVITDTGVVQPVTAL